MKYPSRPDTAPSRRLDIKFTHPNRLAVNQIVSNIEEYYHSVVSHREGEGLTQFLNHEQPSFMRDGFQHSLDRRKGALREAAVRQKAVRDRKHRSHFEPSSRSSTTNDHYRNNNSDASLAGTLLSSPMRVLSSAEETLTDRDMDRDYSIHPRHIAGYRYNSLGGDSYNVVEDRGDAEVQVRASVGIKNSLPESLHSRVTNNSGTTPSESTKVHRESPSRMLSVYNEDDIRARLSMSGTNTPRSKSGNGGEHYHIYSELIERIETDEHRVQELITKLSAKVDEQARSMRRMVEQALPWEKMSLTIESALAQYKLKSDEHLRQVVAQTFHEILRTTKEKLKHAKNEIERERVCEIKTMKKIHAERMDHVYKMFRELRIHLKERIVLENRRKELDFKIGELMEAERVKRLELTKFLEDKQDRIKDLELLQVSLKDPDMILNQIKFDLDLLRSQMSLEVYHRRSVINDLRYHVKTRYQKLTAKREAPKESIVIMLGGSRTTHRHASSTKSNRYIMQAQRIKDSGSVLWWQEQSGNLRDQLEKILTDEFSEEVKLQSLLRCTCCRELIQADPFVFACGHHQCLSCVQPQIKAYNSNSDMKFSCKLQDCSKRITSTIPVLDAVLHDICARIAATGNRQLTKQNILDLQSDIRRDRKQVVDESPDRLLWLQRSIMHSLSVWHDYIKQNSIEHVTRKTVKKKVSISEARLRIGRVVLKWWDKLKAGRVRRKSSLTHNEDDAFNDSSKSGRGKHQTLVGSEVAPFSQSPKRSNRRLSKIEAPSNKAQKKSGHNLGAITEFGDSKEMAEVTADDSDDDDEYGAVTSSRGGSKASSPKDLNRLLSSKDLMRLGSMQDGLRMSNGDGVNNGGGIAAKNLKRADSTIVNKKIKAAASFKRDKSKSRVNSISEDDAIEQDIDTALSEVSPLSRVMSASEMRKIGSKARVNSIGSTDTDLSVESDGSASITRRLSSKHRLSHVSAADDGETSGALRRSSRKSQIGIEGSQKQGISSLSSIGSMHRGAGVRKISSVKSSASLSSLVVGASFRITSNTSNSKMMQDGDIRRQSHDLSSDHHRKDSVFEDDIGEDVGAFDEEN